MRPVQMGRVTIFAATLSSRRWTHKMAISLDYYLPAVDSSQVPLRIECSIAFHDRLLRTRPVISHRLRISEWTFIFPRNNR